MLANRAADRHAIAAAPSAAGVRHGIVAYLDIRTDSSVTVATPARRRLRTTPGGASPPCCARSFTPLDAAFDAQPIGGSITLTGSAQPRSEWQQPRVKQPLGNIRASHAP